MAETTAIEWADSTLNIWEGCQETGSLACVGCYARERNLRYAPKGSTVAPNWGPHAPRREVKSWRSTLRKISKVAKAAFDAGRTEPWFVFVNSLSDFFDNQADPKLRAEALDEFRKHRHLTFLLLTKRPQNIVKMWEQVTLTSESVDVDWDGPSRGWPRNVAIGCTVVTQAEADRDLPHLLLAQAALRPLFVFVSMEPLMEIVDIRWALSRNRLETGAGMLARGHFDPGLEKSLGLDWAIAGGGTDQGKHKAVPVNPDAYRSVRDQCAAAAVAFMHKQNGEWVSYGQHNGKPDENLGLPGAPREDRVVDGLMMFKVGKKVAGRLLDGVEHNARPAP